MLQVLSFEAAAPLFSLPPVQLFCPPLVLHQQMSSSQWSQLLPHHKEVEQEGFASQKISIYDLSYLLLFYF